MAASTKQAALAAVALIQICIVSKAEASLTRVATAPAMKSVRAARKVNRKLFGLPVVQSAGQDAEKALDDLDRAFKGSSSGKMGMSDDPWAELYGMAPYGGTMGMDSSEGMGMDGSGAMGMGIYSVGMSMDTYSFGMGSMDSYGMGMDDTFGMGYGMMGMGYKGDGYTTKAPSPPKMGKGDDDDNDNNDDDDGEGDYKYDDEDGDGDGNEQQSSESSPPTTNSSAAPTASPTASPTLGADGRNGGGGGTGNIGSGSNSDGDESETEIPASLQLELAAFRYKTNARHGETQKDGLALVDVTEKMFGDLLHEKFAAEQFDFVDIFSYDRLAPRVFQFGVSVHFKDEKHMPGVKDIELIVEDALKAGATYNDKYLNLLKGVQASIFATTYAVEYITDKSSLEKAVAESNAPAVDDGDEEDDDDIFWGFGWEWILAFTAAVACLICTALCLCCRKKRSRTVDAIDIYSAHNLHRKNGSMYKTNSFSDDDMEDQGNFDPRGLDSYAVGRARGSSNEGQLEDVPLNYSENVSDLNNGQDLFPDIFRHSKAGNPSKSRVTTDPFSDARSSGGEKSSVKNRLGFLETILNQQSKSSDYDEDSSHMDSTLSSVQHSKNEDTVVSKNSSQGGSYKSGTQRVGPHQGPLKFRGPSPVTSQASGTSARSPQQARSSVSPKVNHFLPPQSPNASKPRASTPTNQPEWLAVKLKPTSPRADDSAVRGLRSPGRNQSPVHHFLPPPPPGPKIPADKKSGEQAPWANVRLNAVSPPPREAFRNVEESEI
mmetsp:Transcript_3171/g.8931  ORF Transcript_3171/g.8931 Transcript_3171/m.8931 type:complete len:773 (-) Transcript_3171:2054-4372(-)|eukprot:CAMPEP_0168745970 /NCGR_PEP_ID=MMETSP0724-20121128/14894_1 /TAXON_ID=265536 /ORGANISM="Amphiprora sp., Strain CCMP467" /LENGTH=772 /DNA_ID=CAMNT_0008793703 /DNA_START=57 /DNA_END=2375 /DNA_ORIENTATION=-